MAGKANRKNAISIASVSELFEIVSSYHDLGKKIGCHVSGKDGIKEPEKIKVVFYRGKKVIERN